MKLSELDLPAAVAAALAARGYENATSVQAAVLDGACAGRDLLVSSETGSGKTVAFGAALAQTLLPGGERSDSRAPVALIIVPTRELAVQVREELRWLLAGTGLRLGSFTGGTPVPGDLAALQRGVDVAIGTPGRLIDLVRRQRLVLSGLRAVVLDEADEMLDLGFRDDLEALLAAAPVERRTLLLSATLPPEIRTLARKFQRDAVAIDPRRTAGAAAGTGGAGGPRAHADITYVAHLVAARDRLAAVVNVLRAADGARAIVFCTTRDGVGVMHAALAARGFSAVAISGERAQAERDRAIARLTRGDARVLVATNVAARGLHLPEVDLIIHADLPLNAESLTHRSGRTGRAGRKGTSVLLATPAERRKAERLLAGAHVRPVWTPPPSVEAIAAAARARLVAELIRAPAAEADPADPAVLELLATLERTVSAREVACRLMSRELARLPAGEPLVALPLPAADDRAGGDKAPRGKRTPAELARNGVVFRINLGAKDKADPRWLLPLICRRGGVTRQDVGAIRIGPRETEFEIAGEAAHDFAVAAAEPDPRAKHVIIQRAGAPLGRAEIAQGGARAHHGPRHPKNPKHARVPHPIPDPKSKPHRR
jgi:ATP-dependent RNA helicase DeaD